MSRPIGYRFPLAPRFWSKVEKSPTCWLWIGTLDTCGYGSFSYENKMVGAHRMSWFLRYGVWPVLCVLHRCDTPRCVRPRHLFLGTDLDNVHDRDSKGRQVTLRGSKSAISKLTEKEVLRIRHERATGETLQTLATRYGVVFSNISMICRRETWTHI